MGKVANKAVQVASSQGRTLICQNRRAHHDIAVEERLEAGLRLVGTEVKSLRAGLAHLNEAYVQVISGNATLIGGHIGEYSHGNQFNHEPSRSRRLLLNRKEVDRLHEKLAQGGYTALPLSIYFNARGRAKLEIGLGRGKTHGDRRQDIKARDAQREVDRVMKTSRR